MKTDFVESIQLRVRLQEQLLTNIWKGFEPFAAAQQNWDSDLESATGVSVVVIPEHKIREHCDMDTAKLERICSSRAVCDVDNIRADPDGFIQLIEEQRTACLVEVAANVKRNELEHLEITPLCVAVKAECYTVTFYFYTLIVVRP